jgi:hypothetical protein
MKKIFVFIILLSLSSQAQFKGIFGKDTVWNDENFDKQSYHFGYFLGFNSYDFKTNYNAVGKDILVRTTIGFNVGLVANKRINESFNLRFEPGLYFNQRNVGFPNFATREQSEREVRSTYIHFPLLIKYSAQRIGNVRPYLLAGVGTALNLSSNSQIPEDNSSGVFKTNKWTNFYEIGVGIDLYLDYFKFSPSIRGVFGMNDELIRDNDVNSAWTSNVASMQTRGIFVNFTFH